MQKNICYRIDACCRSTKITAYEFVERPQGVHHLIKHPNGQTELTSIGLGKCPTFDTFIDAKAHLLLTWTERAMRLKQELGVAESSIAEITSTPFPNDGGHYDNRNLDNAVAVR